MDAGSQRGAGNAHEVLYRTVLAHWRRSHAEAAVLAVELGSADDALASRSRWRPAAAAGLARVLRQRRGAALQLALRLWIAAAESIGAQHQLTRAAAQLRRERAIGKEIEVELIAAHEAEEAARARLLEERCEHERERSERDAADASREAAEAFLIRADHHGLGAEEEPLWLQEEGSRHVGARARRLVAAWELAQSEAGGSVEPSVLDSPRSPSERWARSPGAASARPSAVSPPQRSLWSCTHPRHASRAGLEVG